MTIQLIFNFLAIALVGVAVWLSATTEILKDPLTSHYSFARTIGMWWTIIIAFCFIIGCGKYPYLIGFNGTCLVLLGIGAGTTMLGRVIDNYDNSAGLVHSKGRKNKSNFFRDILSDNTGLAVHRFQALVFNVVFGVIFLVKFFTDKYVFPTFDEATLGLLGISTSTYLGIKAIENSNRGKPTN